MQLPIDNLDAPLYSVGQVSTMLNVQPAFLRRLDAEAVVCPDRTSGGQRRYSRSEIHLVHRVTELVDEGFTLAGVRRLIELEAENARLRGELDELRQRLDGR